ncbi:TAXI family TRAP transporter solute-binding subunit [Anabaena sp. UHCC 0451]|uniref:TAXI family TRAP transporter solute-binding subunit n=1 Tax=Anabaena sp. UHCC 0451 TaxID=2055235 RepID=UPI002B201BB5|nr:TAXI family TRAP transporter solute-binding subunit [Anabaena sp. UHCC 0451]MEA5577225.1 TAXI family TRAP transporter solute-binding subunit [Anabaena sp. UHCC 0451]
MATPNNNRQSNFFRFILTLDPVSKMIFISLGLASIGTFAIIIWNLSSRFTSPQITIAAGDKTGESYIISEAITKVVERRSNIKITLQATGGTSENLELLLAGKADLVTAQADVVSQKLGTLANDKSILLDYKKKSTAKTVAVLYRDLFQLVVKDPKINQFVQLKGKTIALTPSGGQYESFMKIAEHYGLSQKDFRITGLDMSGRPIKNYDDNWADQDFQKNRADAIFRVRAAGNKSISNIVNNYQGKLIPIPQAEAMKIKQPALESAIIPQGAYRGNSAMPPTNLPTVAISRLLLASDQVDTRIIREITQIIYEYRQEIANEIAKEHAEVQPLVANINQPSDGSSTDITLHPGALSFYERDKPSFIQENADYVALILTVIVLTVEWIKQIKLWVEKGKKDEADEYLKLAISLMKEGQYQLEDRQKKLDTTFDEAAKALIDEKISQESFRTFNEAYKTTREAIEKDRKLAQLMIEQRQRENSAKYIKIVVKLLQYRQKDKDLLQQKLDQILEQVVGDLVAENISQESFRTFIEAYKATRDAIERNN